MCVLDASISLSWWNRCAVNFKRHANLSHHNLSGHNTWYIYTGTIYCCLRGDGWRRGWGSSCTINCDCMMMMMRMCARAFASASLSSRLPSRAYPCKHFLQLMHSLVEREPTATSHNVAYKSEFAGHPLIHPSPNEQHSPPNGWEDFCEMGALQENLAALQSNWQTETETVSKTPENP